MNPEPGADRCSAAPRAFGRQDSPAGLKRFLRCSSDVLKISRLNEEPLQKVWQLLSSWVMKKIDFRNSNSPASQEAIDLYKSKSGGCPPSDYIEFCLLINGGRLGNNFRELTVPARYQNVSFSDGGHIDVSWICGIGLSDQLSKYTVEGNEERITFCELSPSEYWVIALGAGNDGFILNVGSAPGKVCYCFFDTGEHHEVAASFSEFLDCLNAFSVSRLS